jgi:hypothetical protein
LGGVYFDTDFFLASDLRLVTRRLDEGADVVAYESAGQHCLGGVFSANFMAAKAGNLLHKGWYESVLKQMNATCPADVPEEQRIVLEGVTCCYRADRTPRICEMPWAYPGEKTAHPVLKRVLESDKRFNISCFSEDREMDGFAPFWEQLYWTFEQGRALPKANRSCALGDHNALRCRHGNGHVYDVPRFFERKAYHLFNTMFYGIAGKAVEWNVSQFYYGDLLISEIFRRAVPGLRPEDF